MKVTAKGKRRPLPASPPPRVRRPRRDLLMLFLDCRLPVRLTKAGAEALK